MQKHVNLVDLVKSFPTNIYLQNLASIQKRTSSATFAHLADKSVNGSISNLSTKVCAEAGGLGVVSEFIIFSTTSKLQLPPDEAYFDRDGDNEPSLTVWL